MTAPAMLLPLVAGGAAGVYEGDEAADPAVAEAFLAFLTQSTPPVEPVVSAPVPAPAIDDLIVALQGQAESPVPVQSRPAADGVMVPVVPTPSRPVAPVAPVVTPLNPAAAIAPGIPVVAAPAQPKLAIPNAPAVQAAPAVEAAPAPAPDPEVEVARVLSLMPSHRAQVTEPATPKKPEVARPTISAPVVRTSAPEAREPEPAKAPDAPQPITLHPAPPAELFAALAPMAMVTQAPAPVATPIQTPPVPMVATEAPAVAPAPPAVVEAAPPKRSPAPVLLPDSPVLPMGSMSKEEPAPAPDGTTHAAPKGDALALRAAILILDSLGGPRERTRPARPEPAPKSDGIPGSTPDSTPVKATVIAGEAKPVEPLRPVISREPARAAASPARPVAPERETAPVPLPVRPASEEQAVPRGAAAEDKTRRDAVPTQRSAEPIRPASSPVLPQSPAEGVRIGATPTTFAESRRDVATATTAASPQTAETRTPVPAPHQVTIELEGPTSDPTRIRVAVFGTSVRATILGEAGQSGRLSEYTGELRQALEDRGFRTASVAVRSIGDTPVAAPAPSSSGRSGSEPEQRPGSRRQDLSEYRQNQNAHDRSRQQRRPEPEEE